MPYSKEKRRRKQNEAARFAADEYGGYKFISVSFNFAQFRVFR